MLVPDSALLGEATVEEPSCASCPCVLNVPMLPDATGVATAVGLQVAATLPVGLKDDDVVDDSVIDGVTDALSEMAGVMDDVTDRVGVRLAVTECVGVRLADPDLLADFVVDAVLDAVRVATNCK
jgi:hypothetical protein